jgi:hypothetical protein
MAEGRTGVTGRTPGGSTEQGMHTRGSFVGAGFQASASVSVLLTPSKELISLVALLRD